MVGEYIKYLGNNPHGYWFKAKWYGWGWVPVTWQGWLVILLYLGVVFTPILKFFLPLVIIANSILIWICYKKGEKPRWSWGNPQKQKKK